MGTPEQPEMRFFTKVQKIRAKKLQGGGEYMKTIMPCFCLQIRKKEKCDFTDNCLCVCVCVRKKQEAHVQAVYCSLCTVHVFSHCCHSVHVSYHSASQFLSYNHSELHICSFLCRPCSNTPDTAYEVLNNDLISRISCVLAYIKGSENAELKNTSNPLHSMTENNQYHFPLSSS